MGSFTGFTCDVCNTTATTSTPTGRARLKSWAILKHGGVGSDNIPHTTYLCEECFADVDQVLDRRRLKESKN